MQILNSLLQNYLLVVTADELLLCGQSKPSHLRNGLDTSGILQGEKVRQAVLELVLRIRIDLIVSVIAQSRFVR